MLATYPHGGMSRPLEILADTVDALISIVSR